MPYTAAQLTQYYTAINGVGPDQGTQTLIQIYANQDAAGTRTDQSTLQLVLNTPQATNTTDVAIATYQFFTGVAPSAAGLAYLRGDAGSNATGLNSTYYNGATGSASNPSTGGFNQENRYYNFSLALAFGNPAAATNFSNTYGGAITFNQAVSIAYEAIVGTPNVGSAAAANSIASIQSSFSYFQQIAAQRGPFGATITATQLDLATKAVAIGYILEEAVKADVGTYAKAIDQFNASTAAGTNTLDNAAAGVNLLTNYQPGQPGYGLGVGGATLGGVATTLTLTTGSDNITQAGPVTINGFIGAGATSTISAADTIAPTGSGNVLSETFTAAPTGGVANGATVSNVQTINVRSIVGAGTTYDLSTVGGVTTVNDSVSTDAVIFTGAATGSTIGLVGNGATVLGNLSFAYATATTAPTLAVSGGVGTTGAAPTVTNTATGATTFNLRSDGAANTIGNLQLAATSTVTTLNVVASANLTTTGTITNITAAGAVAISGGATLVDLSSQSLNVTSINASGLTAGGAKVQIGVAGTTAAPGTAATTFVGGTGNDTLVIAPSAVVTGNTYNAGAGTDTLSLSDNAASTSGATLDASLTATTKNLFTNFEVLQVAANTGNGTAGVAGDHVTFNATNLPTGIASFSVASSNTGVYISNLPAAAATTLAGAVTGVDGIQLALANSAGTADVETLTFNNGAAAATTTIFSAPGVETLNFVSAGTAGTNSIATLAADTSLSLVTITGARPFSLTTGNLTRNITIDGSAATGALTINAAATVGAFSTDINGGSAADIISPGRSTSTVNQLIYGAGGGDTITLGQVAVAAGPGGVPAAIAAVAHTPVDTLIYKASTDSVINITSVATGLGTGLDSVVQFTTAQDKIDLTAFALTNAQSVIADKAGTVDVTSTAFTTLLSSATFYQDTSNTLRGIAEVHSTTGDTYLFVDTNKDGVFTAADLVIKFTGIASVASADILH